MTELQSPVDLVSLSPCRWWRNCHSNHAPFTSEIDSRYGLRTLMWNESVNALTEVVGFLRVLGFPPTGKVDRVGCTCVLRDRPDMSHKVTARDALRKPSTRSGWAVSFVIQFNSQLQVRMISTAHIPTYLLIYKLHLFLSFSCVISIQNNWTRHFSGSRAESLKCPLNKHIKLFIISCSYFNPLSICHVQGY